MRDRKLDRLFLRYREKNDLAALAEVFDQVARELLEIAAHLVHDAADAEDLVQATFLHAIERARHYDGERHLVPWLVGILTREARLWNRRSARVIEPDRLEPHAPPEPADLAQGRELSERVLAALAGLPEPYRSVVLASLRDGRSPAEIARELDRAPGTVRVQLHRGIEMLRKRLPLGLGAGLALAALPTRGLAAIRGEVVSHAARLAGVAVPAASIGAVSVLATGGLVIKKLVLVAVVLVASGVWWGIRGGEDRTKSGGTIVPQVESPELAVSAATPALRGIVDEEPRSSAVAPDAGATVASPTPAATGALRLVVRWRDWSLAQGVGFEAKNPSRSDKREGTSNARGEIVWSGLAPGPWIFDCTRSSTGVRIEIVAGEEQSTEYIVPEGIDVEGRVVDDRGEPVVGAEILLSAGHDLFTAIVVGTSGADGRFFSRSLGPRRILGAREPRHAPAEQVWLSDAQLVAGKRAEVELVLPRACGNVEGRVLDPVGEPVAGARLRVGGFQGREMSAFIATVPTRTAADGSVRAPAAPLVVRTDEQGRFVAHGIELGRVSCHVSAVGFPDLATEIEVEAGAPERIELRFGRGVTLRGVVRRADGRPAAGAQLRAVGAHVATSSGGSCDAEGRYELSPVTPGEIRVSASMPSGFETCETTVVGAAGETVVLDLVLSGALSITGRVLDEHDRALVRPWIRAVLPEPAWTSWLPLRIDVRADEEGRFAIEGCSDAAYTVEVRDGDTSSERAPVTALRGVRAGGPPIELRVRSEDKPSTFVTGRLVDGEGSPIEGGQVNVWSVEAATRLQGPSAADGVFRVGPLPPGRWRTTAGAPRYPFRTSDEFEVAAGGATDVGVLVLDRGELFVATVRGPSGAMPEGLQPDISGGPPGGNAGGAIELQGDGLRTWLVPGEYELRLEAPGCAAARFPLTVRAGDTTRIEARLERGVACTLHVRFGAARQIEWFRYSIEDAAGGIVHQGFGERAGLEAGAHETFHLAPGTWMVRASDDVQRTVTGTLVVTSLDASPSLELAFE